MIILSCELEHALIRWCLLYIQTPMNQISTSRSLTMEHQLLFTCHDCRVNKPKEQFSLRKRDDSFGKKGEPTSRCTECATRFKQIRQNSKRKRENEGPDTLRSALMDTPLLSIEQFTTILTNHAQMGDLCYHAHVSTQELTGDEEGMIKVIVNRVWEATGFRFTCVPLYLRKWRYSC